MTTRDFSARKLFNVPNGLTLLRLLMVPALAVCVAESRFTHAGWLLAAFIIFVIASATDVIDGWLARKQGIETAFGKIVDPIADKALIGTALILLSIWDQMPWWVTGVILFRELGITVLRFWVIRLGVIAASRGGKIKTVLQSLAIGWLLWPWQFGLTAVAPVLIGAALVATLVTGGDYVMRVIAMRRQAAASS